MLKRGQITFFIVLGIVILVVIAFLFFIKGIYKIPEREKVILAPTQKNPVEKYMESCIIKTANEALDRIYLYGGYIDQTHYIKDYNKIPLFTYSSEDIMYNIQPHLKEINYRISEYVKNNLLNCVDFTDFRSQGYNIQDGSSVDEVVLDIQDDKIIFNVDYVVDVERGGVKETYDDFKTFIPSKLGKIFGFMTDIVNEECMGYESSLLSNLEDRAIYEGIVINKFPLNVGSGINRYELNSKSDDRSFHFACQKASLISEAFVENPGITEIGGSSIINLESGIYEVEIVSMTRSSVELDFKKGGSIIRSVFLSTNGENSWPSITKLDLDDDKRKDLQIDLISADGKNVKLVFYKVVAIPPIAVVKVSPSMMNKNELEDLIFDASDSYGISADITSYEWVVDYYRLDTNQISTRRPISFSSGSPKKLAKNPGSGDFGLSISGLFNNGGTYVARLKVIDANGMENTAISNPFTIFNCNLVGEVRIIDPTEGRSYETLPELVWQYEENGRMTGGVKYKVEFKLPGEDIYKDYVGEIYSNKLNLGGIDNYVANLNNEDQDLIGLTGYYDLSALTTNVNTLKDRWVSLSDGSEIWWRVGAKSFCSNENEIVWSDEKYFKKKNS